MKWIRERDALIAQTMAFVQSVTGRRDEALQPDAPALGLGGAVEIVALEAVAAEIEPPQAPFRLRRHICRHHAQEAISAPRCRPASPISAGIRSASNASVRNIVRRP